MEAHQPDLAGSLMTLEQLAAVWGLVDQGIAFPLIGSSAQASIEQILPALAGRLNCTGAEQNKLLRKELSQPLKAGDDRADQIAVWIVKEWGGIVRRGAQAIRDWMWALEDFGPVAIARLIEAEGTSNISSWSKILSFAVAGNHAVYDARTATALNCALEIVGVDFRFVMPSSRNAPMRQAAAQLVANRQAFRAYVGYGSYLELMSLVVKANRAPSLLEAEMTVFANADAIVAKYLGGELQL
jgi:hypothetical protein